MQYTYQAFGIPILSAIPLPALSLNAENLSADPIRVEVGVVPNSLQDAPLHEKPFTKFNEREFLYEVPNIGRYYVANGTHIVIEPLCENWGEILLYFYSNGLASALFQRNLMPFHVSGVFVGPHQVLLFAAPSRTGKSTTALMLQQKGYAPFTDDTALLHVQNGVCYAQASYPMMRLWQNTIDQQNLLPETEKMSLLSEVDKFGFLFHEQFRTEPVTVLGIVFLQHDGAEIKIEKLKPAERMQLLGNNIYRKQWLNGMKKQVLQFKQLTSIAHVLPAWRATRPKDQPSFDTFAEAIELQIIKAHGN